MKKQISPRPKRKINEQARSAPNMPDLSQLDNKGVRYHEEMLKLQKAQLQALLEIKRLLASK